MIIIIVCIYCMCICRSWCICQTTTFESQLPPPFWVLQIKLRLSGLCGKYLCLLRPLSGLSRIVNLLKPFLFLNYVCLCICVCSMAHKGQKLQWQLVVSFLSWVLGPEFGSPVRVATCWGSCGLRTCHPAPAAG